jgi:chromosome segregation ATPase
LNTGPRPGVEELMADETENLVLEHLRAIRTDVAALKTEVAAIKTDVATIKTEQRTHTRTLNVLRQETRMIRAAVNDLAKENVTPGEIEAIHEDLNQLRQDVDSLITKVEVIQEERQKDH